MLSHDASILIPSASPSDESGKLVQAFLGS